MIMCPVLSNPDVAREFNELKEATSEKAAYRIWSLNNGNAIDKAPNGAESKLFYNLLDKFNGDRKKAIQAKSRIYGEDFLNLFGDWTSKNNEQFLNTIDENGEPNINNLHDFIFDVQLSESIYSEIERNSAIKLFLDELLAAYVNEKMYEYYENNPYSTEEDRQQHYLDIKKEFYKNKTIEALNSVEEKLNKKLKITNSDTGRARKLFLDRFKELRNDSKQVNLLVNIAYSEILGIRAEHNVRSVIETYIQTFHQSDVILNALRIINDNRGLSTPTLIRELVDIIEGKIIIGRKTKAFKEFVNNFMNAFRMLLRGVFYPISWTYIKITKKQKEEKLTKKERDLILNDITKWFLSNEQLNIEENNQVVYDMSKWTVSGKDIKVQEKDVIFAIKRGVYSRLKAIKSSTSTDVSETEINFLEDWKELLESIENRVDEEIQNLIDNGTLDVNDKESVLLKTKDIREILQQDQIVRFLTNGVAELKRLSDELCDIRNNGIQFTNYKRLMKMKSDIIGFYDIVTNQYIQQYSRDASNEQFKEGGDQYQFMKTIRNAIGSIKVGFDAELQRYADDIVDKIADNYVDIGDKEIWRNNAKLWLRNKIDGGTLSFLEKLAGPAYASTSPIVRILDLYVREANDAIRKDVLKRGKKLIALYDKCEPTLRKLYPGNFMRYFCEMDENGKPTGYFVSKYKLGTFEAKRTKLRNSLIKKHNVAEDPETGELIFNSDEDRINFLNEYDLERYKLGEVRRYKPEYYIAKRSILSHDTNTLLTQYTNSIQRLKRKGIDKLEINGEKIEVFIPGKLSNSDLYNLKRLEQELDSLGNPYEIVYDSNGNILSIEEKQGNALRRSQEILAWNKYKQDNLSYSSNTVKFNNVREEIIKKYGEDSKELKSFDNKYTTRKATLNWYEELSSFVSGTNDKLEDLKYKRRAILKAIEIKSGIYSNRYDFEKLNNKALNILKELESKIDDLREKSKLSPEEASRAKLFFEERTTNLQFIKSGTTTPFLDYERQKILSLYPGDDSKMKELFYDKYFYDSSLGYQPLSIFSQLAPKLLEDVEENSPIGIFNELDENSNLADDRFDPTEESLFQIDKTRKEFINERYDEIINNTNMRSFYEELLNIMDESWEKLPNVFKHSKYQMPQRRDRSSHLVTRFGSFKAMMSNTFKINENDVLFNEEFTTHADGTIVETVPIRWVKKLDDPTMISTDILGSVVDFYEMALNFREKETISYLGEALKTLTQKTGTMEMNTDQSSRIDTYMSMFVYGRMLKGFSNKKGMSDTEKVITKTIYKIKKYAHAKLMIHSLPGILKNLIDSTCSLLGEVYGGKHFTISMFRKAINNMGKEILTGEAFSLGRTNTKSWTANAMLYNGVSGSTHEMFHNRNESRIRRIIQMSPTIEYTFVDFTFKGMITNMVYDSYRLINNPLTGKYEFMNMEQVQYVYSKLGKSRKIGLEIFDDAKITLRDAYHVTEHGFELKQEYEDIVRPIKDAETGKRSFKLEQRVSGIISERSGVINGVLNDIDKGKLHQNYVGSLVMLMRGFIVSQMADNAKYGHDFARYSSDATEFIDKESIKKYYTRGLDLSNPQIIEEDNIYSGMFNFATGTVDNGVWRNLLRAYSHWIKDQRYFKINQWFGNRIGNNNITELEIYQVRRMNASIISVAIISILSFVLGKSLESDGDNPEWWKLLLYTSCVNSISEITTKLGYPGFVPTIIDLINSLAIGPSTLLEDIDSPLSVGADIISVIISQFSNDDEDDNPFAPVKNGSYSKLPYWIRGNKEAEKFIKAKDGKTPNYIKNILITSSITPGISDLGLGNIVKSTSQSGLITKMNYYYNKQFPTKYLVYNAQTSKDVKKQHGLFKFLENVEIIPQQKKKIKPVKKSNTRNTNRNFRNTKRKFSR